MSVDKAILFGDRVPTPPILYHISTGRHVPGWTSTRDSAWPVPALAMFGTRPKRVCTGGQLYCDSGQGDSDSDSSSSSGNEYNLNQRHKDNVWIGKTADWGQTEKKRLEKSRKRAASVPRKVPSATAAPLPALGSGYTHHSLPAFDGVMRQIVARTNSGTALGHGTTGTLTFNSVAKLMLQMQHFTPPSNREHMTFVDIGAAAGLQLARAMFPLSALSQWTGSNAYPRPPYIPYTRAIGFELASNYFEGLWFDNSGSLADGRLLLKLQDGVAGVDAMVPALHETAVHFYTFWEGMNADVMQNIVTAIVDFAKRSAVAGVHTVATFSGHAPVCNADAVCTMLRISEESFDCQEDRMEYFPGSIKMSGGNSSYSALVVDITAGLPPASRSIDAAWRHRHLGRLP